MGCPIQRSTDQRIFSSSPRLIAAYHVFHRLQRQGIRPLLLITCFLEKNLSSFPCSIVKELAAFRDSSRAESRFEIFSTAEAFSQDSTLCMSGGGGQNRTDDPLLAKQMLSQLSYAPDLCLSSSYFVRFQPVFGHVQEVHSLQPCLIFLV